MRTAQDIGGRIYIKSLRSTLRNDRLEDLDLDDPGMAPDLVHWRGRALDDRHELTILAAGKSLGDAVREDALGGADLLDDVAQLLKLGRDRAVRQRLDADDLVAGDADDPSATFGDPPVQVVKLFKLGPAVWLCRAVVRSKFFIAVAFVDRPDDDASGTGTTATSPGSVALANAIALLTYS